MSGEPVDAARDINGVTCLRCRGALYRQPVGKCTDGSPLLGWVTVDDGAACPYDPRQGHKATGALPPLKATP